MVRVQPYLKISLRVVSIVPQIRKYHRKNRFVVKLMLEVLGRGRSVGFLVFFFPFLFKAVKLEACQDKEWKILIIIKIN